MRAFSYGSFFQKKQIFILPLLWFLINLLQGFFTELAHDEAYYWMYAKNLDIGYFDHPPMIAAMIKVGYFLFKSELGVRIFTILLSAISIPLLFRLCKTEDFTLLFVLFSATSVFQTYSFIAVPDGLLIFFAILFFLVYRSYLNDDKYSTSFMLGLIVAALLYSKYHSILILFFTLCSNIALLKRKSFYIIVVVAVSLYLPHILWQIQNDYPSYQYHVLNKSQAHYTPLSSLEFLLGQLVLFGPFAGVLLIYAAFKQPTQGDLFMRALKFTFLGILVFFFVSTFNSRAEANWTAVAAVPMLLLSHLYISTRANMRKWAMRIGGFSICLFLIFRVNLMFDFAPVIGSKALPEFYGWKTWAQQIDKQAKGAEVAIMNSYQRASKFSFYAQHDAISLNNTSYRRNQYDLWSIVDSMQGKRVLLILNWNPGNVKADLLTLSTNKGDEYGVFIDNFRSYTKINIATGINWFHFKPSTEVEIPITINSPYPYPVSFDHDTLYPVELCYRLNYFENFHSEHTVVPMTNMTVDGSLKTVLKFTTPAKEGPYYLRIAIRTGWLPSSINSRLMRMDVEN